MASLRAADALRDTVSVYDLDGRLHRLLARLMLCELVRLHALHLDTLQRRGVESPPSPASASSRTWRSTAQGEPFTCPRLETDRLISIIKVLLNLPVRPYGVRDGIRSGVKHLQLLGHSEDALLFRTTGSPLMSRSKRSRGALEAELCGRVREWFEAQPTAPGFRPSLEQCIGYLQERFAAYRRLKVHLFSKIVSKGELMCPSSAADGVIIYYFVSIACA